MGAGDGEISSVVVDEQQSHGAMRTTDHYGYVMRGDDLPQSKLNETLVRRIRAEHAKKEADKAVLDEKYSAAAFAKRYGVSVNTITKVLGYATWRHVR